MVKFIVDSLRAGDSGHGVVVGAHQASPFGDERLEFVVGHPMFDTTDLPCPTLGQTLTLSWGEPDAS